MASTYSTNLALELMANGDQSGTWGTTNNTNLGTLIEQAISGYVTQAITDGSGANTTITIPNGATGVARNMTIEMTGALTFATCSLIVPANKKLYFIYNNTTGGHPVTVKVSGQTGVAVPAGKKVILTSNGTDIVEAVNQVVGNFAVGGTTTLSGALIGAATQSVFNTVSTTVDFAGAATTLNIGKSDGTNTVLGATRFSQAATFNGRITQSLNPVAAEYALRATGQTTGWIALDMANTGGNYIIAGENSGGNNLIVGDSAYDMVVRGPSGIAFSANAGAAMQMRLASTGLSVTGTLGVTGTLYNGAITPSSWATFWPLEGKVGVGVACATNQLDLVNNAYYNAGWKYANASQAVGRLEINSDALAFDSAGSGTPGNAITFTNIFRADAFGIELGGTVGRATTNPTNAINLLDGTAPVGSATGAATFYCTSGEMRVMDAAGNATLLSPHDEKTNEWIYDSVDTRSGKRLRVDMERMVKFLNDKFGTDFVHES